MKVSLNWIKQFLEFDLPPIDELVRKIGSQLGEIEGVTDLGKRYQGIIVAKVISCEDHPNADRLHVCKIDDGHKAQNVERDENGYVQVVCGAPNVREGLMVAWLPPGSTVPESYDKDPFVLEARDLRGATSNGMLASSHELAISDDHSGILEIDKDANPGDDFAVLYKLDDYIIDIENKMFTHRPDCFGALGVAREIAGILGHQFTSPQWYRLDAKASEATGEQLPLEIKNELPELVPRFMALPVGDVIIKPSPVWLQVALSKLGQKPINNVVDLTNFYMLLTGQPLHAYDYDKVKALSEHEPTVVVRYPRPGEKINLLNGKEIEPRSEAVMIATDKRLIGVGGVMGGADTEVDEHTKNIILECATFDMYSIRRTSMVHGLFTDAVTRFNKGQSPLQNLAVLARVVESLRRDANGRVAGPIVDISQVEGREWVHPPVTVTVNFVNERLGLQLTAEAMKQLLENVEFGVAVKDSELTVTAPFWRTDIELREDVVEEIGRLYGFDKLPLELPYRTIAPAKKDSLLETKAKIRTKLAKAGANEVLTYSFVHGNLLDRVGQEKSQAFRIANALSPDLQYYRLSLLPSLLEKVHPNIKAGYDQFAVFELGKTHGLDQAIDDQGLPREFECTALVLAAADKLKKTGAAYYEAREYLENLVGDGVLDFQPIGKDMEHYPIVQPYAAGRSAIVSVKGGEFLGIIGEFKPAVARALKLPAYCAGFEVDTMVLEPILAAGPSYAPLSRFPSVKQDITLRFASDLPYAEAYTFVNTEIGANGPADTHIRLEPVALYQSEGDMAHRNITFRLTITGYERTLTDGEVSKLFDAVAAAAGQKFGAKRI